ncbi:hypothetical protein [Cystobacter fuscus]|uniref:hypothetical protein n=1 Tax=Cystobacter fuscus TaxID=43 RepID=UPI0037C07A6F
MGPQGPVGPAGPPGSSAPFVPIRTTLFYTNQVKDLEPSDVPRLLRTVGTFTKELADTVIELTWQSHIRTEGVGGYCSFDVRIDGASMPVPSGLWFGATLHDANDAPVNLYLEFPGLAPGSHEVTLWTRGVNGATACIDNSGSFLRTVHIVETY